MRIGVPKEVKLEEYRVAATPHGVSALVADGHDVTVERGAGEGSGFADGAYVAAGARLGHAADAWAGELVLKVKEPQPGEYAYLREDLVLFGYLHLVADRSLTAALIAAGTTAIAYETVRAADGRLPLLAPMSAIAGQLAVQLGVGHLQKPHGGRGVLAGSVAGVDPARIVVVGGGVVGYNAALIALGLGAQVQVLDTSPEQLERLRRSLTGSVEVLVSTPERLAECVAAADLVVGAVLVPGAGAPRLITEAMVASMGEGSVLCDVSIDQGGCAETSRPTTYAEPAYRLHGVIHCCVANLPGAVPVSSTLALTDATMPYVRAIAASGWRAAIEADQELAHGVNVATGRIVHPAVASTLEAVA